MNVGALYNVDVIIDSKSHTKIDFMVKARSNYKPKSTANNVSIYIPIPEDAEAPHFKC